MNQVPHIKRNFWNAALAEKPEPLDVANRALELQYAAEANAEQEQYITADEARKLGVGNAQYQYSKNNAPWTEWITCHLGCGYEESDDSWKVKYRAIKHPEPTEPQQAAYPQPYDTTNLVKLDGKLMSREAAVALWESKKDTCDLWYGNYRGYFFKTPDADFQPNSNKYESEYQIREKPKKQLDPAIREGVIALLQELNFLK